MLNLSLVEWNMIRVDGTVHVSENINLGSVLLRLLKKVHVHRKANEYAHWVRCALWIGFSTHHLLCNDVTDAFPLYESLMYYMEVYKLGLYVVGSWDINQQCF